MGVHHLYITGTWLEDGELRDEIEQKIIIFEEGIQEAKKRNPDYFPANIQVVFDLKHYYMIACEPDEGHDALRPTKKWTIGDNSCIFWLDAYELEMKDWEGQWIDEVWQSSECAVFVSCR